MTSEGLDRVSRRDLIQSAEIITIGTEMLLGDLVDTNTAWMSSRLAALGVGIYRHTTVGDNRERLIGAMREAAARSDLVLTTGGLGPTTDDLTNECLAILANRKMVERSEAREHVDDMFARLGMKPTPSNYKQALFPEGAELIPNPRGTAMGALLEVDGTLFATFPGVPVEMRGMLEETLEPLVRERTEGSIVSRTLHFTGIGESALAEQVQEFLDATDPTVAPLAGQGKVRLRITARGEDPEEAKRKIEPVAEEILSRIGKYYFGEDEETLESAVGRLLEERGETLSLAESCTGGLLAKRLTDRAGSSAYFAESVISYSDAAKHRLLGVPEKLLTEYGAVSEEVACAMAEGVRGASGADYGLSITGVAGPDGGTEEKPVGLVWLGLAEAGGTYSRKLDLTAWAASREAIRERSANRAFDLLRRHLEPGLPSGR